MFKKEEKEIEDVFFVTLESDDLTKKFAVVPIKISDDHKSFVDLKTNKVYPIILHDTHLSLTNGKDLTEVEFDKDKWCWLEPRKYKYYTNINGNEVRMRNYDKPIYGSASIPLGTGSFYSGYSYTISHVVGYEDMPIGKRGVDYNLINDINEWYTWRGKIEYVDFSDLAAAYDISPERSEVKTNFTTTTEPTSEKISQEILDTATKMNEQVLEKREIALGLKNRFAKSENPTQAQEEFNELKYDNRRAHSDVRSSLDDMKGRSLIGLGVGGAAILFATLFHNSAVDMERRSAHIEKIQPQIDEYIESVKTLLSEKYPNLDFSKMNSNNVREVLRDNYLQTKSSAYGQGIIDPQMSDFREAYTNNDFNYITDSVNAFCNNFDHYPLLESLKEVWPIGIGALGVVLVASAIPIIRAKIQASKTDKEIKRIEKQAKHEGAQILAR